MRSGSGTTAQPESLSPASVALDYLPRFLPTPTTAGRSSLREATKRETDNAANTANRSKFTAQKGALLSDTLGFRVNRDGTECDSEDNAVDTDDKTDDQTDDQLFNSKSPFVFLGLTGIFCTRTDPRTLSGSRPQAVDRARAGENPSSATPRPPRSRTQLDRS